MSSILTCPFCRVQGVKQSLARITAGSEITVQRSESGTIEYTTIHARDFSIFCGRCNNMVYAQEIKEEMGIPYVISSAVIYGNAMQYYGTMIIN